MDNVDRDELIRDLALLDMDDMEGWEDAYDILGNFVSLAQGIIGREARAARADTCATDGEAQAAHEHGTADCESPHLWRDEEPDVSGQSGTDGWHDDGGTHSSDSLDEYRLQEINGELVAALVNLLAEVNSLGWGDSLETKDADAAIAKARA